MAKGFPVLWKGNSAPNSIAPHGTSVLLPPGDYGSVAIVDANGKVIKSFQHAPPHIPEPGETPNPNEEFGNKYYLTDPGAAFGNDVRLRIEQNGEFKYVQIPNGAATYRGHIGEGLGSLENPGTLDQIGTGMEAGGPFAGGGQFAPGQAGFGFYPGYLGGQFPTPVLSGNANYKFTNPLDFAKEFGDFSRSEITKNSKQASALALDQLNTELRGLTNYVPAASALKRKETAIDNIFNQEQRTAQIDSALPGVRGDLEAQADRARTYASGAVPDSITDRGLELGIRSSAADQASVGGFGASSSVSRKISDLLSADQRINLSKYGDQLLTSNIGTKSNLLLAPTEYSNAGSQISVMPSISGSQLASNNLNAINQQSGISAGQALSANIQQNQFQTGLEQNNNQFNAQIQNQSALNKFQYDTGYAAAIAGANQLNSNTQFALQQQAQQQAIFQDYLHQAQQSQQTGAIAGGIGTAIGAAGGIGNVVSGIGDAISSIGNFFGLGSSDTPAGDQVFGDGGGGNIAATSGGSGGESGGTSHYGSPGQNFSEGSSHGGPEGSIVTSSNNVPFGYDPIASTTNSDGGAGVISVPSEAAATSLQDFSQAMAMPNLGTKGLNLKTLVGQSSATLNSIGLHSQPAPGTALAAYNNQGKPIYSNLKLAQSTDTNAGFSTANILKGVLDPLGVFTKEDSSKWDKIKTAASDVGILAQLTSAATNKDAKGFVNGILGAAQQPLINELTKGETDPSKRAQDAAGYGAAFTAYQLYNNWNHMSPAQKSLAVANLGIQGFQFSNGTNLATKPIIEPTVGANGKIATPGLNVGQAINMLGQGINVYSLTKNWDQLNALQKVTGGIQTASGIANTAKQFGLLGAGTQGAEVAGVTAQNLAARGWTSAPNLGVGAIKGAAGSQLPSGYVSSTLKDGTVVAVPKGSAASLEGSLSGYLSKAAGVAGIAGGAYAIYKGWGQGGVKGAINGALGGSSLVAGLSAVGAAIPIWGQAALIVGSILGDAIKVGKSESQKARDAVRGNLKATGLLDKDTQVTLADGTKVNVGIDGHGGYHSVTNQDQLAAEHKGKINHLNAWDVDYTNDLDFTAGMGGIALSRILNGGKDKKVDQLGNQLGNAAIANIGYGKDFSAGNFTKMRDNLRAMYAQSGIKSKADAFQLANQAYAEGRINDTDVVAMHQSFNMIFDNNGYETAQKIMSGRQKGAEVAASTPEKKPNVVGTKELDKTERREKKKEPRRLEAKMVPSAPTAEAPKEEVKTPMKFTGGSKQKYTKDEIRKMNRLKFLGAAA